MVRLPDSLQCHPVSLSGSIPLPSYSPSSIRGIALSNEVADLQAQGAVEPAPLTPGYYSCLFVTPKVTGVGAQPFCSRLPFLHGDGSVGSPVSSSGRLDGVPGPPGRLSSGSCAPVISALPELLRGGFLPAVSCSLLRPLDYPSGVHAHHGPYLFHHAPLRFPGPTVSRLLARPRVLVSR